MLSKVKNKIRFLLFKHLREHVNKEFKFDTSNGKFQYILTGNNALNLATLHPKRINIK